MRYAIMFELLCLATASAAEPPRVKSPPRVKGYAVTHCICGDACQCAAGACPAQCPVQTPALTPAVQYQVQRLVYRGRVYEQLVPVQTAPTTYTVPQCSGPFCPQR